jgi:hypothetical protein
MLVIPALGRLKMEDYEFEASMNYIARLLSQKQNKKEKEKTKSTDQKKPKNEIKNTKSKF